jgi:hypothetical protein
VKIRLCIYRVTYHSVKASLRSLGRNDSSGEAVLIRCFAFCHWKQKNKKSPLTNNNQVKQPTAFPACYCTYLLFVSLAAFTTCLVLAEEFFAMPCLLA